MDANYWWQYVKFVMMLIIVVMFVIGSCAAALVIGLVVAETTNFVLGLIAAVTTYFAGMAGSVIVRQYLDRIFLPEDDDR